jgi:biotin transporter BioY
MGPYFPGFAISLVVACLIYSFWQHKKPIRLWRIALAQLCTVIFVYLGMNIIWMSMMHGKAAASFYTGIRVFNNAITFPFMVGAVFAMAKMATLIESRYIRKD